MTDDIDRAQEREQIDRELALRAARLRIAEAMRPRNAADDGVCTECHGAIEPERRKTLPYTNRCACCALAAEAGLRSAPWKA